MAGDWIKMKIDLADEPEVIGISDATGLDEDSVVGKLHRIWGWADQKTTDGNASCVTKNWIDRYLNCAGFADAMEKVGWLSVVEPSEDDPNGGILFPKFTEHNTETGKQRALTNKRVAQHRKQKSNANCNASSVTKALPEKRREEKISITNVIDREDWPKELQTDQFETAWTEWNDYRRQAKIKKYTATGAKKQLSKLAAWGVGRAVAAIDYSITQGYKGIFEEKTNGRTNHSLSIGPGQRYDPNYGPAEF